MAKIVLHTVFRFFIQFPDRACQCRFGIEHGKEEILLGHAAVKEHRYFSGAQAYNVRLVQELFQRQRIASELFLHILPQITVKVGHIVHGIARILNSEGFRDAHDVTGLQIHPGSIHGQKIHLFGQGIGMIHIQRILKFQDQIRPIVIHGH